MDSDNIILVGRKYGLLTVVRVVGVEHEINNNTILECQCGCGAILDVPYGMLEDGDLVDCGCMRKKYDTSKSLEVMQSRGKLIGNRMRELSQLNNGTIPCQLTRKIPSDNTSGVKGVCWTKKKNKWKAYIGFRGKVINLGYFRRFDDAVKARKEAEEKYFAPILKENEGKRFMDK